MQPAPVVVAQACSVCGLDWKAHLKLRESANDVTIENCVDLLKRELTKAQQPKPQVYSIGAERIHPPGIEPITKEANT